MFIDKARIHIQAGKGGDGCLSFRREKFVPRGGPDGGNGGKGGDFYLVADRNLTTLLDFVQKPHYKAEDGQPGGSTNKTGKNGADFFLHVPCGTVVYCDGQLLGDLCEHQQKLLMAKGGRGGRGNLSFKTSRNSAPRIAEKGEPGEVLTLDLELKLIADCGIIGHPNAGKSTLLARISQAKPKIADYPFTTLSPNLGVVRFKEKYFIVADIPGLIEGAHQGRGLGIEFLRHIERTKVLIHLLDPFGFDKKDAFQNYNAILKELSSYSKELSQKPMLVVVNKMDLTNAKKMFQKLKKKLKNKILAISAVTGEGVQEMIAEMIQLIEKARKLSPLYPVKSRTASPDANREFHSVNLPIPPHQGRGQPSLVADASVPKALQLQKRGATIRHKARNIERNTEIKRFVFAEEFKVEREKDGFRVIGKKVERLSAMTNFQQEEAVQRFQNILKKMGVETVLKREGIQPGDTVYIGTQEFIFQ